MDTTEKRFESDIEASFLSKGGFSKGDAGYDPKLGLYPSTIISFIQTTQPKEWKRFLQYHSINPEHQFCLAFNNACGMFGLVDVLRNGFKHRGITFHVCYFKPESSLNVTAEKLYSQNIFHVYRQWHYSADNNNSVDMVLVLNGIPLFAIELKNQYTGQTVENAMRQWMYDRDPREICFQFNKRVLVCFCVDHTQVMMTTKLAGTDTRFLPFNQGSNGAGNDGGAGNPPNPDGYPTAYFWEYVFEKDSMMDIVQKFIHVNGKTIIFPRYHQLDVVRKLIADVKENGAGKNYLTQHSAGSGKSNSIAWTAYRLASLHDAENNPIFSSVIVVTDRRVLDQQLQTTIASFDHTPGVLQTIGEDKTSKDLRDAINGGTRIIVTTLQKFPVIYDQVDKVEDRNYAIICDEAHSSQTGDSAMKLKVALGDKSDALAEYKEFVDEDVDENDIIVAEMLAHGKHKNLSFFAFTATPKGTTLEMFGTRKEDGFHPFHIYSMKQAIEEGFILDVLQNYMTYDTCFKIVKNIPENPEVPSSRAAKVIRKYQQLHPYNISQKSQIIVETFMETTRHKINGKGKMMVVTDSRLAAVKYTLEIRRYIEEKGYDVGVLVAFSGSVVDGLDEYTESGLNVRKDGTHISENQTKAEFHDNFDILIVAEKYQTGFDEPLLHTMIVDKKLRGVKTVQTLSRLNRTCPGKNDTFILDFANTNEDIQKEFQPFYQETMLSEPVNTDLLYQVQNKIHLYGLYSDEEIDKLCEEYVKEASQGRMTSVLLPIQGRYNGLQPDERYQLRRLIRTFIKWYSYVSQVVRMFDEELHKEFIFLQYLICLLPADSTEDVDLAGKLELEYYKLQKTFEGEIRLESKNGVYEPATANGVTKQEEKKPLEEIIELINERFKGNFTEADRVLLEALKTRLMDNDKLRDLARTSDPKIFMESIFPGIFGDTAEESYIESQEVYTTLFEDKEKYTAIMMALAAYVYREMNK